jgi:hypothetical protein
MGQDDSIKSSLIRRSWPLTAVFLQNNLPGRFFTFSGLVTENASSYVLSAKKKDLAKSQDKICKTEQKRAKYGQ